MADIFSRLNASPGASILAYCISSISMTLVNKYVVSGQSWNLNFLYLAIQSVVCSATIIICKRIGLVRNISRFDWVKAKRWFPISILLVAQIYTGAKALQFLSVPVYTIFKNLAIIVIAYGEVLWFGGKVTSIILLSFGLMVFSSVVAAWADIHAVSGVEDVHLAASTLNAGYAWMACNVVCSASFVLGMRRVITKMGFKDWDTMFYNNLLAVPVLLLGTFTLEDWSKANLERNFPIETRNALIVGMIYSGLTAILISYTSAWCIRVTSSTTYSMVGALNKLPIAVSGLVFFDAPVTFGSVSAVCIAFVSGIAYTWGKVLQKQRQTEASKMELPTILSDSSQGKRDEARA